MQLMKREKGITLIELLNFFAILLVLFFAYKITYFLFSEKWVSWLITAISFSFLLLAMWKMDVSIHAKILKNVEDIFLSVKNNDISSLQNFFDSNKYILNIYNSNRESLLLFAVKCGNMGIVDFILSNRAKHLPNLPQDNDAYNYALDKTLYKIIDLFEKNGYHGARI